MFDFDMRPLVWLAYVGLVAVVVGVPIGLWWLIAFLVRHIQWVS